VAGHGVCGAVREGNVVSIVLYKHRKQTKRGLKGERRDSGVSTKILQEDAASANAGEGEQWPSAHDSTMERK